MARPPPTTTNYPFLVPLLLTLGKRWPQRFLVCAVMKLTHPMFNSSGWKRRFRLKPYSSLVNNHNTVSPGDSNSESASVIDDQLSTRGSSDKSVITTSSYTHSMAYTADSIKPVSNHFAYPDSPKADSLSVWSDAAGEPLINDSKSDVIPRSVRPLDLNSSRQHAEDDQFYSSYQDPILESADLDIPNNTTELPRTPDTVIRKSVLDTKYVPSHKQNLNNLTISAAIISMENNHLIQLSALQVNIHHEIKVLLAPLSLQRQLPHHMALLLSKQEACLMRLSG